MRTTLTLDDDLALALKERARKLDQPFKQVVNDALRRGLSPASSGEQRRPVKLRTFSSPYAPGVDPERLKDAIDELDVEHYRKLHGREGVDAR